ncbi:hypothetical protein FKM82_000235 [Ascaphus truei]
MLLSAAGDTMSQETCLHVISYTEACENLTALFFMDKTHRDGSLFSSACKKDTQKANDLPKVTLVRLEPRCTRQSRAVKFLMQSYVRGTAPLSNVHSMN